eukprot:14688956-Ditylum_brightwellii.AAC.1
MSTTTRSNKPFTGSGANCLVGLDTTQIKKLENKYSITLLHDLALLDKEDVGAILGMDMSTFLVRWKLLMVTNFISKGRLIQQLNYQA